MPNLKFKIQNSKFFRHNNGYVTITVLILMIVLAAITYLFAEVIFGELSIARNNRSGSLAFTLAEAGVQEAIYKVQYDGPTRAAFLDGTSIPSINRASALINNGAYTVTFQNTNKGVATITSVGEYTMGAKKARREVRVGIAQATSQTYLYDAGIFTHAATGNATGDIEIKQNAILNVYDGGLIAGRHLDLQQDTQVTAEKEVKYGPGGAFTHKSPYVLNCQCLITDTDPLLPPPQCSPPPVGCTPAQLATAIEMPRIDIAAYEQEAKKPENGTYFTDASSFLTYSTNHSNNLTGIFYVDGQLTIDDGRKITLTGVLISSQNITIGGNTSAKSAELEILKTGAQPSGVVANNFSVASYGKFSGTGLIFNQESTSFDSSSDSITWTGGILSRRIYLYARTLNIHFDRNAIIDTLDDPFDTPVVELNHWEEEY